MALAPGTRLGPYEILDAVGAGGMGEVYRARDPRLGRDVAVKVLPAEVSLDADRLGRFEREARAAAALNHPNVLAVYDIGTVDDVPYLVSELLEGETLRAHLGRTSGGRGDTPGRARAGPLDAARPAGALPIRKALDYAAQIAGGLAAAHGKGIVHRDIKPENIFITADGHVKILDFGLVKLTESRASADVSTLDVTHVAGAVLGTPGYMSPEQAAGRAVDFRSDQFSLGATLYEMLTGRRLFERDSVVQTLAATIDEEPVPIAAVNPNVPPPVRWIVERCLAKDPGDRFASTLDLARDLRGVQQHLAEAAGDAGPAPATPARSRRRVTVPLVAGAALLVILGLIWLAPLRRRTTDQDHAGAGPGVRLTQATSAEGVELFPAWSPDSTRLAYAGEAGGRRRIFVRSIATGEEYPLTSGAADDIQPAWSPDGRTVLFVRARGTDSKLEPGDVFGQYEGGDLWSIDLQSRVELTLVEQAFNPSSSPDGQWIAVDASWAGPRRIWAIDSRGRNPKQLSSDSSEAAAHVMPKWSPDGTAIVFQNIERTKFDIKVLSVPSGASTWVTRDAILDLNPVWASAREIYFSSVRGGGVNVWRIPVGPDGAPAGSARQVTTGAGQDVYVAPSPDGSRIAFATLRWNADVWRLPVSPGTGRATGPPESVIATSREESRAAASPDGRLLAFNSDRGQDMNIWLHSLDTGADRQLTRGPGGDYQPDWSPDGARVAFFSSRSGNPNIWVAEIGTGRLTQLTRNASVDINPAFSPDGRLIAYQSDQDGRLEVWVMRPDGSGVRQLTHIGVSGHFLRWSPDSTRVIFRSIATEPSGLVTLYAVPAAGGEPVRLWPVAGGSHISFSPSRALLADVTGHHALWITPSGSGPPRKLYAFDEGDVRIDYPAWTPDGRWILFERSRPQGGDIWMMEGFK